MTSDKGADAVHLRDRARGRKTALGDGPPDAVMQDMQYREPSGNPVL